MHRLIAALLLVMAPALAFAGPEPVVSAKVCTITGTGTGCTSPTPGSVVTLTERLSGNQIQFVLDRHGFALVGTGTWTTQVQCQESQGGGWLSVSGGQCSASCVIPYLPNCYAKRFNTTVCTGCSVDVYLLKERDAPN